MSSPPPSSKDSSPRTLHHRGPLTVDSSKKQAPPVVALFHVIFVFVLVMVDGMVSIFGLYGLPV